MTRDGDDQQGRPQPRRAMSPHTRPILAVGIRPASACATCRTSLRQRRTRRAFDGQAGGGATVASLGTRTLRCKAGRAKGAGRIAGPGQPARRSAMPPFRSARVSSRSSSPATPAMRGWALLRSMSTTSTEAPYALKRERGSAPAAISVAATTAVFSGTTWRRIRGAWVEDVTGVRVVRVAPEQARGIERHEVELRAEQCLAGQ